MSMFWFVPGEVESLKPFDADSQSIGLRVQVASS
jgi:hypothetical protein